jgi:hypothetical protein
MAKLRILLVVSIVLMAGPASADPPRFVSEYSSLSNDSCKMIESGIDYGVQRCPAHDGYDVHIYGGEGTSSIGLKKGKGKEISLYPERTKASGLPEFTRPYVSGDRIEWRYDTTQGKKTLVGLIYRVGDQSWPKEQTYLFVTRVTGTSFCPLALVKTNEEAREMLDNGNPCPK